MDFQGTLFDAGPATLPALDDVAEDLTRTPLTRGAWIDVRRNWLADADDVFEALVRDVPWRAERRQMYDRVVDVPRLRPHLRRRRRCRTRSWRRPVTSSPTTTSPSSASRS